MGKEGAGERHQAEGTDMLRPRNRNKLGLFKKQKQKDMRKQMKRWGAMALERQAGVRGQSTLQASFRSFDFIRRATQCHFSSSNLLCSFPHLRPLLMMILPSVWDTFPTVH